MFEYFILKHVHKNKSLFALLSFIIFTVLLAGFFLLAILVAYHQTFKVDFILLRKVRGFSGPFLPELMKTVSLFGETRFAPITLTLITGFLFLTGSKKEAFFTPLVLIGSFFTYFFKGLFARPRPAPLDLNFGYVAPIDYSFPSGHVVFYTTIFGLLAFFSLSLTNIKRVWRLALFFVSIFLILFVGVSRVYLGVHWPSDVLGGYLIGLALLEILVLSYLKFIYLPKVRDKKNHTNS